MKAIAVGIALSAAVAYLIIASYVIHVFLS
jgi:hypothetical protein